MGNVSSKINSVLNLAYYKGNIVFSYAYFGKTFRYNAFKVPKDCFNAKTKHLKQQDDLYDYLFEIERIENLAKSVNTAIIELMKDKSSNFSLTKKLVDECILRLEKSKLKANSQSGLITDFEEWIEAYKEKKYKEEVLKGREGRKNHPSSKDYTSTKNLLIDFEYDNYSRPIQPQDIDEDFILELIEYCYLPRESTNTHKYKTEGEMVNKTIQKRLDSLFTFLVGKYGAVPNGIKKPHLDIEKKKVIRLDREELKELENLDIKEERFVKVRNYFLFLCYTGLRFGDFAKLDKTYYDKENNELVLTTNKTNINCRIYLFDKAKRIGEKYNFSFKGYTNQALNRAIKEMLQHYNLYTNVITVYYMQKERKTIELPKNEFISCHTGRKTFISIMIEYGLDTYDLMSMTGHKKIDTLKYYIDLFGIKKREKLKMINAELEK